MEEDYIESSEVNTMRERKAYTKAEQRMFEARSIQDFLSRLLTLMKTPRYKIPRPISESAVEWHTVEDSETESFRFNEDVTRKLKESDQRFVMDYLIEKVPKRGIAVLKFEDGKLAFEFKQIVVQEGDVYKYAICLTASRCKTIKVKANK